MGGQRTPNNRAERRTLWISGAQDGSRKTQRKALAHVYAEERHALPNARETFASMQLLKEINEDERKATVAEILDLNPPQVDAE